LERSFLSVTNSGACNKDMINKIIALFFLVSFSTLSYSKDFTWVEKDELLTKYTVDNKDKLIKYINSIYARRSQYQEYIYKSIMKNNAPNELIIVAAIESGFKPNAVSHAGAAGMWQFMPATAREQGMIVNKNIDDRMDWKIATDTAVPYLKTLTDDHFYGDYELSLLAYNAGANKTKRLIKKHGTRDPWHLIKTGDFKEETVNYLLKFTIYRQMFDHYDSLNK
jgi:membrane-bound lytic murein transglycosylase D